MEERLRALERWREQAETRFHQLTNDLRANTTMTASVKADTAQLVDLFKASKVNLSIIKWAAGVGAAIAAIYGAVYTAFRHFP